MTTFDLTPKQQEANALLASDAQHVMLLGGSRSGKTFLLVRGICMRAIKAAKSRHAVLRFRFNHVKQSIVLDTFPMTMANLTWRRRSQMCPARSSVSRSASTRDYVVVVDWSGADVSVGLGSETARVVDFDRNLN